MKVAVLGFGTVGAGIFEMLKDANGLEQGPVLVRPGKDDAPFKRTSIEAILAEPGVEAVAEAMGGIEPAFSYAMAALKAGKHFVTSNKALVAAKGIELAKVARENHVGFLFSAACGGAVPFLHNLSIAVEADTIVSLGGILNGTTNYMLDAMQRRSLGYGEALSDAQRLGYAEADPTADVSGLDALRKIVLGSAVAYGVLPTEGLYNEGIENITALDVKHIQARGLTCRLMAKCGPAAEGKVYAYVEPVLLKSSAAECSVLDNYNMARYEGKCSGPMVFMGQGAGRWPTASAVLRDLDCLLKGRLYMFSESCHEGAADNSACSHCYYVRLPSGLAGCFESKSYSETDGQTELITRPMSVKAMHELAASLRAEGAEIFFAALED
jgi:homoserine dehydrogenase